MSSSSSSGHQLRSMALFRRRKADREIDHFRQGNLVGRRECAQVVLYRRLQVNAFERLSVGYELQL